MKKTMLIRSLPAFVMLTMIAACTGSRHTEVVCGEEKHDTIPYVILNEPSSLNVFLKGAKPATLSNSEITSSLGLLTKAVDNHNNSENVKAVGADHLTIIDLKLYKVQFLVGEINKEKWVFANCFCESIGHEWTKELVMVKDGGKCYFQVKLNITKGEYTDFMINGNG